MFISVLGIIVILGLIMVYSSSYIFAKEIFGDPNYFILRQSFFAVVGLAIVLVIGRSKFFIWWKYAHYINWFCVLLLVLTFVPGLGPSVKGARRWLSLGPIGIQPGEFVKYSILLCSYYFFENYTRLPTAERIKYLVSIALPMLLLVLQPDFGTFSICFIVVSFTCFMSSFPRRIFYSSFGVGVIAALGILISAPYRVQRLLTFLDPWKNPKTSGFQIIQSYLAFANGSITGLGLGNSNEKLFYLPEAHNDFIFSVIGEELGLIGVLAVIILFLFFAYAGLKLALQLRTRPGVVIVSSIIFTISIQAFLNMAVVLGLVPTKGLNLPFISYGGSSLMANFFAIGLVLSAIRQDKAIDTLSLREEEKFKSFTTDRKFGPLSNF